MHKVLALLAALGAAEHVVPHGYDGDAAAAAPLADPERLRELASQQRVLSERVAELERLAFDGQGNPLAPEETSLLEQFGVSAREFLVHRLSPRTDPECRWHYAKARCAPMCTCGFQYKFGDYTLSRSCRLLPSERVDAACDPRSIEDEAGAFEKLSRFATKLARDIGRFLDEAAPRTDGACRFALGQMQCEPSERCAPALPLRRLQPRARVPAARRAGDARARRAGRRARRERRAPDGSDGPRPARRGRRARRSRRGRALRQARLGGGSHPNRRSPRPPRTRRSRRSPSRDWTPTTTTTRRCRTTRRRSGGMLEPHL